MRLSIVIAALVAGGAAGQSHVVEGAVHRDAVQIQASDDATIGYRVREPHGLPFVSSTVVILPGYTMTAKQFDTMLGPSFDKYNVRTVSIDYRGFGLSTGAFTPETSPTEIVYEGLRMSRLAMDAMEVLQDLQRTRGVIPEQTVLLGHSMGVEVWTEFFSLFLGPKTKFGGFAAIDGVPKFTFGAPRAADATYPDNVLDHDEVEGLWRFGLHNTNLGGFARACADASLDYHEDGDHYPRTIAKYHAAFQSYEGCAKDPSQWTDPTSLCYGFGTTHKACCVTQDQSGLDAWFEGTNDFQEINGMMDSTIGFNDLMQDYTDTWTLLRRRGLPVFVYGGEYSLIPEKYMRWAWDVVRPGSAKSKSLFFEGSQGNHAPWLNTDGSAEVFLKTLGDWVHEVTAPSSRGEEL